jgi:hypothetical protein
MSDQSFETEPHSFCIGHCATGFLRVAKGDLVNVKRLLHTSIITISIQRYKPYLIGLYLEETIDVIGNWARSTLCETPLVSL